jgi:hypothetical protein
VRAEVEVEAELVDEIRLWEPNIIVQSGFGHPVDDPVPRKSMNGSSFSTTALIVDDDDDDDDDDDSICE